MLLPNIIDTGKTGWDLVSHVRGLYHSHDILPDKDSWEKEVIKTLARDSHKFDAMDHIVKRADPKSEFDSRKMFLQFVFLNKRMFTSDVSIITSDIFDLNQEEMDGGRAFRADENQVAFGIVNNTNSLDIKFLFFNTNQNKGRYVSHYDGIVLDSNYGRESFMTHVPFQSIDSGILFEMNGWMGDKFCEEFATNLSELISKFATHDVSIHGITNHFGGSTEFSRGHFSRYAEEPFALLMHKKIMSELSQGRNHEKGVDAMARLGVKIIGQLEEFAGKSRKAKGMVDSLMENVVCYHLSTIFSKEDLLEKHIEGTLKRDLPEMAREFRFNEVENYVLDRSGRIVLDYTLENYLEDVRDAMEADSQEKLSNEVNAKIDRMRLKAKFMADVSTGRAIIS